jgi:hypothetical protein
VRWVVRHEGTNQITPRVMRESWSYGQMYGRATYEQI